MKARGGKSPGFAGLSPVKPGVSARFSVLPVPYDRTVTYVKGTRNGPAAIIEASANMELYDEELRTEPGTAGIETLVPLDTAQDEPRVMLEKVRCVVTDIAKAGRIPVVLGGEHSITPGAVGALKEFYPNLSVLQLDAHADMRDTYQGTPYSHACVARRLSELCPLVGAGIRSLSQEEADFLARGPEGITTVYASDLLHPAKTEGAVQRILRGLTHDVYITIDLDVFDPSIMPATGTPEPGGLSWHGVTSLIRGVTSRKRVVGFDVVELAPMAGNVAPDFMAARLTYRVMGYINEALKGV